MSEPVTAEELRIVPANEATWQDLVAIFGTADYPYHCQCQRFKVTGWLWRDTTLEERVAMHRAQHGLRRTRRARAHERPRRLPRGRARRLGRRRTPHRLPEAAHVRVPWTGRHEDKDDEGVWAVTCFCVRKGYRGRGITYPLAQAAADHARERGATAVEAYPMVTEPGRRSPGARSTSARCRSSRRPGSPRSARRRSAGG